MVVVMVFDKPIPNNVNPEDYIFIIEMNNDINMIMGIGLIKNIYKHTNRSRIYSSECWNEFIYKSKYHIDRKILLENDKSAKVIKFLELFLFYGSRHFKRGQGCVIIPDDRISTYQSQIQNKVKKVQYCRKCGLPRKGHKCERKMLKLIQKKTKCAICHETKKGHICPALKKNLDLLNKIHQIL